jgi:hypothetical protein
MEVWQVFRLRDLYHCTEEELVQAAKESMLSEETQPWFLEMRSRIGLSILHSPFAKMCWLYQLLDCPQKAFANLPKLGDTYLNW